MLGKQREFPKGLDLFYLEKKPLFFWLKSRKIPERFGKQKNGNIKAQYEQFPIEK